MSTTFSIGSNHCPKITYSASIADRHWGRSNDPIQELETFPEHRPLLLPVLSVYKRSTVPTALKLKCIENIFYKKLIITIEDKQCHWSYIPIINTSAEHSIWHETMSIWHCGGSNGNSAICLPSGVNAPVWSNAPRIHNWYNELRILSCGGGSMKWNCSKSTTPSDFSSKTVLAKLVLEILEW